MIRASADRIEDDWVTLVPVSLFPGLKKMRYYLDDNREG